MSIKLIQPLVKDLVEDLNSINNQKTNCITKIPQDINLELVNGTLTLKMGSKVYIPNGVGVFEESTILSDLSTTISNDNRFFVFYNRNTNTIDIFNTYDKCYSGDSSPSDSSNHIWYDTTSNTIKIYSGDSYLSNPISLPLCLVTCTNSKITSIDKVFNGLGYVGSTIFALPGVEGLIPNERDKNGSLINDVFKTENVLTHNVSSPYNGYIVLSSTTIDVWDSLYGKYDIERNVNLYNGNKSDVSIAGNISIGDTGYIISFNSKNTFQYVDRNEAEGIFGKSITINYLDD